MCLVAPPHKHFPVASAKPNDPEGTAKAFLAQHGKLFGVDSKAVAFTTLKAESCGDYYGVRLQQTYAGVPVFSGEVGIQVNSSGGVEFVTSDIMGNAEALDSGKLSIVPNVSASSGQQAAIALLQSSNSGAVGLQASEAAMVIYEPSVVGNTGSTCLAWDTTVTSSTAVGAVGERVLVDAHTGEITFHYSLAENVLNRQVTDVSVTPNVQRTEGQNPTGNAQVDQGYQFLGNAWQFYSQVHNRDSLMVRERGRMHGSMTRRRWPLAGPLTSRLVRTG